MPKLILLLAALSTAACATGGAHHEPHADGAPAAAQPAAATLEPRRAPQNPVQAEMQLLEAALMKAVRSFAEGDLRPIAQSLHEVHQAKERTEAAIADGSYRPPKNPEAIDAFVAMDEAFHDRLVDLVRASRANDPVQAGAALGQVLAGCDGCHQVFRR
jgi:cytochrome c556